ncbi:MerR family transcriptional regulator [Lentibacillus sp. CBA3610]|uniref:MerR family transcriptional regulator n=1 Tax=Lentibacillus sp. CBA3610 TaxID=2518176 RepID=UPI0015961355|nr:MerR family transcriptional regulator [Lentibacillus sp. CBA3610]QKY68417.1 MerR family transcriptional regulator [Lentibacillus sp. CBA3610]
MEKGDDETLEFFSIESLSHIIGVHKYTLKKWTQDFNVYIPKTKLNNVTCYRPDGIDVLTYIKQCSDQGYDRMQIKEMLAKSTFPVRLENMQSASHQSNDGGYKENVVTMMQTIGKVVSNVDHQQRMVEIIKEKQKNQNKLIKDIKKQTDEIDHLKREIETLKQACFFNRT